MMASAVWKGTLLNDEPLAKYTSWRVGGPAQHMYIPENKADLIDFISGLPEGEPLYWLGLGSNLLVRDGGIKGTVINTRNRLKEMRLVDSERVYVEAGVPCAHVARFCADLGLTGAEFLAGIPGTMGGALKMNAGAFGGETWRIVDRVEMVNARGQVVERDQAEFEVAYRSVKGLDGEWFLSAQLKLVKGNSEASQQHIKALLEKRNATQPTNKPTCGSVFKNPPGDFAARLIEACGLKGFAVGGAVVSEKHANFIENQGNASSADIEALIEHIQTQVQSKFGISLQTEVCRVGDKA
ncbi:UDP-N-acetylmuramate dehydrogenase [Methylomonas koyamae]|uniref:UDP-N-acetylenolpyruvoylglucosamine reductase n=1 Tax=Methylomonas koyamae TaxID=702114 RepID=A0A291IPR7_9GAMM|nr:UDP-N-acetylmuramate dehydrogenase [Methylomonas koyamae]ATG92206.1 UDP-N-acetylenolpyruvoylglucosamine reductase [Methylomonas koyamae]OAI25651.1 UDP-N-acetylenolpyruvoylglucosamine reductase [Methylomonas koyamae]